MQNQPSATTSPLIDSRPWQNKCVAITGAGQGLGSALARALARRGATVALLGRSQKKLEKTYDAIVDQGGAEPLMMPLDFQVADAQSFSQVALNLKRECGELSALVHCAAHLGIIGPVEHQKSEEWQRAFTVNALAPVQLTRACSPLLVAGSRVAFCLDHHVFESGPYWGGYIASKHALWGFAQTLDQEWHDRGIGVQAIVPGPIDSPLRRQTHPGESAQHRLSIDTAAHRFADALEAPFNRGALKQYLAQ